VRHFLICHYPAQENQAMRKSFLSNSLLAIGVVMLGGFAVMETTGLNADPLLPAFAAFCIGCTAVLDRIGVHQLK
jgi:hypothetical protein